MVALVNQIRVWRHGLHLVEFGCLDGSAPADVPPHCHPGYQISLELTGAVEYHYRGRWLTVSPGRLVIIHPGEVHAMRDPGPRSPSGAYRLLNLHQGAFGESGLQPFFEPVVHDALAVQAFTGYVEAVSAGAHAVQRDALLAEFLRILTQGFMRPAPPDVARGFDAARMRAARDLLLRDLAASPRLEDLARSVGLDPAELCRQFRRCFGLPPHRFLVNARVELAKRLLARGEPITTTAGLAGFADQSHLTRHFKRLVQVSPGRYSAARKNVQDPRATRG